MAEAVPKIVVGPFVDEFLKQCSKEEQIELYRRFFSLLVDPVADNTNKFDADYFPFTGRGVLELVDDVYLITYHVDDERSVHILRVFRRKDLPTPP